MANELPPVVTELKGELADLVAKLAEAKALMREFNDTVKRESGDTGKSAGESLGQKFFAALGEARSKTGGEFGRVVGDFDKLAQDAGDKGGKGFVSTFVSWLGSKAGGLVQGLANIPWVGAIFKPLAQAMQSMPPEAQLAIAGAIAAAIIASASFIGAALNGVILGALGLGGIALGIVGQIQNPVVEAALSGFTDQVKTGLADATSAFGPALLHNFGLAADAVGRLLDTLHPVLDSLAVVSEHLTAGLMEGLQRFGPGLAAGLQGASVVLDQLARDLPGLFGSFGQFWKSLAAGSTGASQGFHDLLMIVEVTVVGLGYLIQALSQTYQAIHALVDLAGAMATGDWAGFATKVSGVGTSFHDAANHAFELVSSLAGIDKQAAAADKTMTGFINDLAGFNDAAIRVKIDVLGAKDALDAQGKSLDQNTLAGAKNTQMIQQWLDDIEKAREAAIKQAGGVNASKDAIDAADTSYNQSIETLKRQLIQLGYNKQALDAITGDYYINIHENVSGNGVYFGNPGNGRIGAIAQGAFIQNGMIHAAQGFLPPRDPGTLVLAGEPQTGGEVMIPQRGISQQRAAALGTVALAPYGLGVGVPGGGGTAVVEHHTHVYLGGKEISHTVDMIYPDMMAKAGQRRRGFGNSGLSTPYNPAYPTGNTFGGS